MYNNKSCKKNDADRKPIAVVTGASRGIGAAVARALAAEGYDLAICCRQNKEMIENLAGKLRDGFGTEVFAECGDVSNPSFVFHMGEKIERHFGQVDVVVNNAGISHVGLLCDMSVEEWRRILDVNLSSCFYMAKTFAPGMVRRKRGHIIQISSMWGSRGASCEVAYSASKGGMDAFTKALAKELAPSKVAVNAISCGVIDTEMNAFLDDEEKSNLIDEIPWNRFGKPEEVASAVVALLKCSYITGQIIGVDGGI